MDAVLFIYRKVHDRTVHHWRGLLCIVVSGLPPRVRGRKMDSRRKATGGEVPHLGNINRLQERALAVGRTFIFFGVLVALPLAPALRADLVFTRDGLLRRVAVLSAGPHRLGRPTGRLINDRRRGRHVSERDSRHYFFIFDYRNNVGPRPH